ncbi:MAG: putative replication initiation protein [Circoviridae sp.]|nr:MAG: putative replication initiation protein [Circoviridae sp.]
MLKTRLHDGTPLMEYFRDLRPSFWKGSTFANYSAFEAMIMEKEKPKTDSYFWIQFPCPNNATPEEFAELLVGLERYVWFRNYWYNIEFQTERGIHIHSHLLLDNPAGSVRPARIIANIASHLKLEKNHIECKRWSHSRTNRLNYLKGMKIPQSKMENVDMDKTFREKYNLKNVYTDDTKQCPSKEGESPE